MSQQLSDRLKGLEQRIKTLRTERKPSLPSAPNQGVSPPLDSAAATSSSSGWVDQGSLFFSPTLPSYVLTGSPEASEIAPPADSDCDEHFPVL